MSCHVHAELAAGAEVHGRRPRPQQHHGGQEVRAAGVLPEGEHVAGGPQAQGAVVHHRPRPAAVQVLPPASGRMFEFI